MPALALAADQDLGQAHARRLLAQLDLAGDVAVRGADDGGGAGGLEAVLEIVGEKLVRRGDRDGAQLVQAQDGEPELIVPLEHQHDPVALPDAEGGEVVCRLGRGVLDVLEGEAPLRKVIGDMEHGELLGRLAGDLVDDIEGEVEAVLILEMQVSETAFGVLGRLDELLAQQRLVLGLKGGLGFRLLARLHEAGLLNVFIHRHNHGEEGAVLPVDGDHAVGGGAVIVDAVALVQDLLVVTHAHAEGSLDNKVELLTGVGRGMDRFALQLGRIRIGDPIRRGHLFAEERRHVLNDDTVLHGGDKALIPPVHGVRGQARAAALQELDRLDAHGHGGLVQKGEGQVDLAGFVGDVLFLGNARAGSHLRSGKTHDVAQLPDTERDL